MPESPHTLLLDRKATKDAIHQHFGPQLEALKDIVNYGTNLVPRAFGSSGRDMSAIVTCYVFLKQVVAMVDAVDVLLREGAGHACHLPARGALEAALYLHYVIENDSERRAMRYYVADIRDQQVWAKKVIAGTAEAAELDALGLTIGLDSYSKNPVLVAAGRASFDETTRILKQPRLESIDQEFTAAKKKRKRDVDWYMLDGLGSLRQLAQYLNRLAEYEAFYSRGSQVMHSGSYRDHVQFKGVELHATPIRHIIDFNQIWQSIVGIAIDAYYRVVRRYRSGEIDALVDRYKSEWQKAFLNAPTVNYRFEARA